MSSQIQLPTDARDEVSSSSRASWASSSRWGRSPVRYCRARPDASTRGIRPRRLMASGALRRPHAASARWPTSECGTGRRPRSSTSSRPSWRPRMLAIPAPERSSPDSSSALPSAEIRCATEPLKIAYNMGIYATSSSVMIVTYYVLADGDDRFEPRIVGGHDASAALVFAAVNLGFLAQLMPRRTEGQPPRTYAPREWQLSAFMAVGGVGIGMTAVCARRHEAPALLPFVALPALALWYAYGAAAQHAEARERNRWLVTLGGLLAQHGQGADVLAGVRRGDPADRRRPGDAGPPARHRSRARRPPVRAASSRPCGPTKDPAPLQPTNCLTAGRPASSPAWTWDGQPWGAAPRLDGPLPPQPVRRPHPRMVPGRGRRPRAGRAGRRRRERHAGRRGVQRPVRGDRQAHGRRGQHLRRHRDGRRCGPGAPVEPDHGTDDRGRGRRHLRPDRTGTRDRADAHHRLAVPGDASGRESRPGARAPATC